MIRSSAKKTTVVFAEERDSKLEMRACISPCGKLLRLLNGKTIEAVHEGQ